MVKKSSRGFSIYGHVNKRQRIQQPQFEVRPSPSPSPEMKDDPADQFAREVPSTSMGNVQSGQVNGNNIIMANRSSPASPMVTDTMAPSPGNKLGLKRSTIEAVRRNRGALAKPKFRAPFAESSEDEAQEVSPAEEVDRASRLMGITTAALFRKEQPSPIKESSTPPDRPMEEIPSPSENAAQSPPGESSTQEEPIMETVEPESYGSEHLTFFMHTRRSLRGQQNTNGEYTGRKLHIAPDEEYFDLCSDDELFESDDDTASLPVKRKSLKRERRRRHDTVVESTVGEVIEEATDIIIEGADADGAAFDAMDVDETPARLVRTRSKVPASQAKVATDTTPALPQSDAEMQKLFTDWITQLIKQNDDLQVQLDAFRERAESLQVVLSAKEEEYEKLDKRWKDLRAKQQRIAHSEAQVGTLKIEVEKLREEVTSINRVVEDYRQRNHEQAAKIVQMNMERGAEKTKHEKQVQDLQRQITGLRSGPRPIPSPPSPSAFSGGYSSPLSRALGRTPPLPPVNGHTTPTRRTSPLVPMIDASKYNTIHDLAMQVVTNGAGFLGGSFGDFGRALQDLKEMLEKEPKVEA